MGARPYANFGPRLPFLMKIIAADRPLSLQAHPSRAQAEAGFAEEESAGIPVYASNRTYRDTWPKPEVLCALGSHRGAVRLPRSGGNVSALRAIRRPRHSPDRQRRSTMVPAIRKDRLKEVFRRLLRLSGGERAVIHQVAGVAESFRGTGPVGSFAATIRELAAHYPGDPGVLAALLMNRITLHRHEAIFLAAGKLHAYLRGGGVEIMANSDNVMRGGLTPKFINVEELLKVLDFEPGVPDLVSRPRRARDLALRRSGARVLSLAARRRQGADRHAGHRGRPNRSGTEGSVQMESASRYLAMRRGESALVTAGDPASVRGSGTVFVGSPGLG